MVQMPALIVGDEFSNKHDSGDPDGRQQEIPRQDQLEVQFTEAVQDQRDEG